MWIGTGENNSQRSVAYGDGVYRSNDGGSVVGEPGAQELRAHREDPDRPARFESRAGRRAGARSGRRGRPRPVRDARRRQDVEGDPHGGREHRRDRRRARPAQPRRALRRELSAAPPHLDADRRRTRARGSGRRSTAARRGRSSKTASRRRTWGGSASRIAPVETRRRLRRDRSGEQGGRLLPLRPIRGLAGRSAARTSPADRSTTRSSSSIPRSRRAFTRWTPGCRCPRTAARRSTRSARSSSTCDNHVLWIDPADTDHLIGGCDGGLYETWDRGATWAWSENLPLSQFYKLALGRRGAVLQRLRRHAGQQHRSAARPARERCTASSTPTGTSRPAATASRPRSIPRTRTSSTPESQHGVLVRYDKRTGEQIDIQPQPGAGEPGLRWNWDSPLIISPHASHAALLRRAARLPAATTAATPGARSAAISHARPTGTSSR